MEKPKKKKKFRKKVSTKPPFPFDGKNFLYFFIGLFLLLIGYIFMLQGPANSFWSRTLAPVFLAIKHRNLLKINVGDTGLEPVTSCL